MQAGNLIAQRTTRSEQGNNLEMDYPCVCTTERGMKIHRTKIMFECFDESTAAHCLGRYEVGKPRPG